MEMSPALCHVKAKFKLDPSNNLTISTGSSELKDFVTKICPADNTCATASVSKFLKQSNSREYEGAETVNPINKWSNLGFFRCWTPLTG